MSTAMAHHLWCAAFSVGTHAVCLAGLLGIADLERLESPRAPSIALALIEVPAPLQPRHHPRPVTTDLTQPSCSRPRRWAAASEWAHPFGTITPDELAALRTRGDLQIAPDEVTKRQLWWDGAPSVVGTLRVCLAESGEILDVSVTRSTTYSEYDCRLLDRLASWTFRPYVARGQARRVCGTVTLRHAVHGALVVRHQRGAGSPAVSSREPTR